MITNMKDNFIFIPALIGQVKNMHIAKNFWKGQSVSSFARNSIDPCPYILASAWWEMRNAGSFREKLDMPDDLIFYGDSGGYQSIKKGVSLDVVSTLKWQEANCNRAMAFDHPPSILKINNISVPTSAALFDRKMQETYVNNTLALSLRDKSSNTDYYNIMQGETLYRRDRWYDVMKDLPFEHIAIATRPSGSGMAQAVAACHLHSKGYSGKVHVLGVGSFNVLPVLAYVKDWFEELTVDSSTYGQGVRIREYYINMQKSVSLGSKDIGYKSKQFREKAMVDGLECQCTVCKTIDRSEVSVLWDPGSMGGGLITAHNLRVSLDYVDKLNALSNVLSKKEYKNYFQRRVSTGEYLKELSFALEFIDDYKVNGIEHAYQKYIKVFDIDSKLAINQKSLF